MQRNKQGLAGIGHWIVQILTANSTTGIRWTGIGLLCCVAMPVEAQNIRFGSPSKTPAVQLFLPTPRELRQELTKAAKEIANEEFVDAITRLDAILNGGDGTNREAASELKEDYFLTRTANGVLRSLKSEATRMLADLPPAGRKAYELQFGTEARQQLTVAISSRDSTLLSQISRRFGYTNAGQEATMLLGRDRLERGRPLEAVMHFQRLADHAPAATRFGEELRILLATSLMVSDRDDPFAKQRDGKIRAALAVKATDESPQNPAMTIGGQEVAPIATTDPVAWLTKYTGKISAVERETQDEWLMFGGNPGRGGLSDVGMPLMQTHWDVDFAVRPDEEQTIDQFARELRQMVPTPVLFPLVTKDWVLMRSTDQLWGVDPKKQGKLIWEFPWSRDTETNGAMVANSYEAGGARRPALLKSRVWEDALYGQLSSDGDAVYLLNKLKGEYSTRFATGMSATNELVALDLKREGSTLWIVGGEQLDDEPELAGMFFLSAPLPVDDQLYAVGEVNSEIRLMSLDKRNGKLIWSQQLAHIQSRRNSSGDGQRRMKGVNLAYSDGILVCPTSAGGVVAVDVATRAFLWGFRYADSNRFRQSSPRSSFSGISRWRDNAAMISNGKVVLTALDSNELICLDLLTGERIWKTAKTRDGDMFVAGEYQGKLITVGPKALSAVNMQNGEDVWTLPLRGRPSGRGVQSGGNYFLATAAPDELAKIDLSTGTLVESVPTDEPLGNLVAFRDQLYSQNHKRLRAFHQRNKLQARVDAMLAKNENDPWALEHRGLLLLDQGERLKGIDFLRKAIANYPKDGSDLDLAAKQVLVATSLAMLRDSEPGATALAKEIEPLIAGPNAEFPDKQIEFLRVMTSNFAREGNVVEAFRRNLDLLRRVGTGTNDASKPDGGGSSVGGARAPQFVSVGKYRRLRHDRWHRTLFHDLWRKASESERTELDEMVESEVSSANPNQVRQLFAALQDLPTLSERRLQSLRDEVERSTNSAIVEGRLLRLQKHEDADVAGRATALLAKLYRSARKFDAATDVLASLEDKYAATSVFDDMSGEQFVESMLEDDSQLRQAMKTREGFAYGRVDVTQATPEPTNVRLTRSPAGYSTTYGTRSIDLQYPFGIPPFRSELVLTRGVLQSRDGMGKVQDIASLNVHLPSARITDLLFRTHGHLLIATRGATVVAINALHNNRSGDAVIWHESSEPPGRRTSMSMRRTPIGNTGLSRNVQRGINGQSAISLGHVSDRGVIMRRYGELVCLDPESGDIVWSRDDVELSSEVWGDDDYVFVHVPGKTPGVDSNARVFSAMDGRELESRSVPDQFERVRMFGRYVLSYKVEVDETASKDISLEDVLSSKELKGQVAAIADRLGIETKRTKPGLLSEAERIARYSLIRELALKQPSGELKKVLVYRFQVTDTLDRDKPLVWSHTTGLNSRSCFVRDHELAIYDPDAGRFVIINIGDGSLIVDQQIEMTLAGVTQLKVERRAGLYIAHFSQRVESKRATRLKSPNASVKLQNLEIHAFTSENKVAWVAPAIVEEFMPAQFFATRVPALVFLRRLEVTPKRKLEVLVLDARDGRQILNETRQEESGHRFEVTGELATDDVRVSVPASNGVWRLRLTDAAKADGAPYGQAQPEIVVESDNADATEASAKEAELDK